MLLASLFALNPPQLHRPRPQTSCLPPPIYTQWIPALSQDLRFKNGSGRIHLPIPLQVRVVIEKTRAGMWVRRTQRQKRLGNGGGGKSGRRLWHIRERKPFFRLSAFSLFCQHSILGNLHPASIHTRSGCRPSHFLRIMCFIQTTGDTMRHISTRRTQPRTDTMALPMNKGMSPRIGCLPWPLGRTTRILTFGTSILLHLHPENHLPLLLRLPHRRLSLARSLLPLLLLRLLPLPLRLLQKLPRQRSPSRS
ncbi:hypothetical protein DFH06DRAFT_1181379 [Mycena polygramma]|nr:hypothetical protein DFH06DRAFT_1181374 [Mycena polygramma]KAJ7669510.1 hypothetical protein DFH06DRAFT_1181379 [Mycena polygramma]